MVSSKLLSGDITFIFEFSFSPDSPLLSPPSSPPQSGRPVTHNRSNPYVECLFYREDVPDDFFHWEGNLSATAPVAFSLPADPDVTPEMAYPDDNNCKGTFKLYKNSYTGGMFVWFDIQFGPGYLSTFEGDMVTINPSQSKDE
ncbi:MAG: hypothetical protein JST68_30845 [Bacteroidetes bacterium]|nr:hypothetical protein [Bacteroidota bacterium]